tara:strand:- start:1777 stop:2025 length:249 start_codon:yes stop_codon:yes gene_type:complete
MFPLIIVGYQVHSQPSEHGPKVVVVSQLHGASVVEVVVVQVGSVGSQVVVVVQAGSHGSQVVVDVVEVVVVQHDPASLGLHS